ncbi:MAG TPA: sporulation protein, partial [Marinobacter adhaerens]|nr:sporulation protein [Marinobacter adhaerens]
MTEESLNSLDGGGLFPRLQQRYSLRANPLEMETPFFPDAMRHHALEALRHLCGFGDMALLLTGAAGSGKTRILAELVRSESSRLDFHRIPAAALTSVQALARDLKAVSRSNLGPEDSP